MTIPRLMEMLAYWKDNPPVHVMVAAYFGLHKNRKKPKKMSDAELEELMKAYPQTAPDK